jgi:hypothetical protein
MSPAGRMTRSPGAELEQRYRRLLRLYPHEFRARRADEMLGVLMASAGKEQSRPARSDVSDIVRGSLGMRLRGPRGGWPFTLAAFALAAPLFLVLRDILLVAFPSWESQAAWQRRVSFLEAHGFSAADVVRRHAGGVQLLSQPPFLLLVIGHLIVAAAVLAGLRRTALAALVIVAAAGAAQWHFFAVGEPDGEAMAVLTSTVLLLEAVALAAADPRAARRREGWQHMIPALALAIAMQTWALAFDFHKIAVHSGDTIMVTAFALTALAVLLPLPLGLGWRTSLLLAAACYPLVILDGLAPVTWLSRAIGTRSAPPLNLAILFLPPLLVLCWAAAQTIRTRRARNTGNLAA